MYEIKFRNENDLSSYCTLSGTFRPSRLIKNIKHTWRRRRPSLSTRPIKRAKDRKEDLVVYTLEGSCDSAIASQLEAFSKDGTTYRFYNPLVVSDDDLCTDFNTRCPINEVSGEYGYDQVIFSSCEVEQLAGKKPEFMYKYRINLEEAKKY